LHIIPHLGGKRLDKIQVKDIRQWLNKLTVIRQCCAQEKMPHDRNTKGAAVPSGGPAGRGEDPVISFVRTGLWCE
jgi:hypothetical protein